MGTEQSSTLNTESGGTTKTAHEYVDRGDGTPKWLIWFRKADGGDATLGAKADTAVTAIDTTPGSAIALLKGIISTLLDGFALAIPRGATAVAVSSGNVANASAVAAMPATASVTNWVCGFEVCAAGATAGASVTVTLAGILGGTMSYTFGVPTGAAVIAAPLIVQFSRPIPASATNTAITLTCPALGAGNLLATANIHGFRK